MPVRPVPEEAFGLMRAVKAYETMTVEAAVSGSRSKALAALLANPLVGTLSRARAVLDDLVEHGDFRPLDGGRG